MMSLDFVVALVDVQTVFRVVRRRHSVPFHDAKRVLGLRIDHSEKSAVSGAPTGTHSLLHHVERAPSRRVHLPVVFGPKMLQRVVERDVGCL